MRMVLNILASSSEAHVMSALGCRPKISGAGTEGKALIESK